MSGLTLPRIIFSGTTSWNPNTVNNNPDNYDETGVEPVLDGKTFSEYAAWLIQMNSTGSDLNGSWNVYGDHAVAFSSVTVTGIQLDGKSQDTQDPLLGKPVQIAAPGAPQLNAEQATKAITERVAAPLQNDAAETVTLWSRWQNDQGQVSRMYGEKWAANATWDQLKKLAEVRPRLSTVYDPAKPEVDATTDLKALSEVFGQVYVHAA